MSFDIRRALVRLSNGFAVPGSPWAVEQAISQFDMLLDAAKKKHIERPDIQGLKKFQSTAVTSATLGDSIQRLLDALDIDPDEDVGAGPVLSQKFGILRAEPQLDQDFTAYTGDHGGLGVLFFDIDNFKRLNTKYTEFIVDQEVLIPFQQFLLSAFHSRGFGYSVGGDEFIVLLRNADPKESIAFAERLRRSVETHDFGVGDSNETVTISIGLACFPGDSQLLPELREMANKAENSAKTTGRNKIVCWSDIRDQ